MRFSSISKKVLQNLSTLGKRLPTTIYPPKASSPEYFEKLKAVERQTFSKKRLRFNYTDNYTAALALPQSIFSLARVKRNEEELLKLAQSNIIEHSNRRVDLFFYTLIAYYHTNALPVEGHTSLQHGKGRTLKDHTNVTQGCHSSIIPAFLDQTIYKKGKMKTKSLLSATHFFENLNATVELPYFVNAFDDLLEAICRPKSIEVLREVSLGKLNPIEGLEQFLIMMSTVLNDFKKQATSNNYSFLRHSSSVVRPHVQPKLIDLVIRGTLGTTFSSETRTVNEEYVQLLLRMTPVEKRLCTLENKAKIYLQKIMELQSEILTTKREGSSCSL
jgi:hypothetical protein